MSDATPVEDFAEVEKSDFILEALANQSKTLLLARLDAEFGQVQAEARAADPEDPVTSDQAEAAAVAVQEVSDKFDTVSTAAGVAEADIIREVTSQRKAQLAESLTVWRQNLEVHISFRDHPEMWGGMDFSGAPLVFDEQAVHVKTLEAAIVAAEAELGGYA